MSHNNSEYEARIAELEAALAMNADNWQLYEEVHRLRALLTVAGINPNSDPQEIRDQQRIMDERWFEQERELKRLREAVGEYVVEIKQQQDEINSMEKKIVTLEANLESYSWGEWY